MNRVLSEICAPDDILYKYKTGELTEEERKDVEKHLEECEACSARLKELPDSPPEDEIENITVPEKIRKLAKKLHKLVIKEIDDSKLTPKRGEVWTAKGDEYFWQPPKLVVVMGKINDNRYYVVPIDGAVGLATDLDVYIDIKDDLYIAACEKDGEVLRSQLITKIGTIDEYYLKYISDMILYIAGKKGIDINEIPHGAAVRDKKDIRIPFIEDRNKALDQLFGPASETE